MASFFTSMLRVDTERILLVLVLEILIFKAKLVCIFNMGLMAQSIHKASLVTQLYLAS